MAMTVKVEAMVLGDNGLTMDVEVIGTEVDDVIEAVNKLKKELAHVVKNDALKGRWVEAEG